MYFLLRYILVLSTVPVVGQQTPPFLQELNSKLVEFCPWPGHPAAPASELEMLLRQGADPNYLINPYEQETLIDRIAADDGLNEHVQVLINHCKLTNQSLKMNEALRRTVFSAAILNATSICTSGVDLNSSTVFYDTALDLLILYSAHNREPATTWANRLKMAKLFIDHGARMDFIPAKKRPGSVSQIQLAVDNQLPEFVELFRAKIAENEFKKLHTLKTLHPDSYISLLPLDLLQELSCKITHEEFLLQQKGKA